MHEKWVQVFSACAVQAHLVLQPSDIVLLYCREICLDEISYKEIE